MNINIPPALKPHAPFLKEFFEGMLFKLNVNAHKDDTAKKDIPILIDLGLKELQELRDQLATKMEDPNTLAELFDMSNFNYLLFQFLRRQGVPDEREQFIKEFFRVDVNTGRVFASRTRSGSRYKEGDEIVGTKRGDRTYIRIQHAVTGSMISCARADIVWFAHYGEWPDGTLNYVDEDHSNDAIQNLVLVRKRTSDHDRYPFVFERSGDDGTTYGYQRRHRGILVRVGYWGDRPTAASEGIKAWKAKVKEINDVGA